MKSKPSGGKADLDSSDICHRIFSTSPTANQTCVIKLSFLADNNPATTELFCGVVALWNSARRADKVVVCPKTSDDDDDDL